LFCYSDVRPDDADAVTATLKAMVENWRDTAGIPDQRLAEQIREDGIDILVDLRGHGAGNRLLLFARRAAPVQVNMVGYFDTTGLRTMDWRVTDERQDPSGVSERFHTERLARLPGGCWCYAPDEEIGGGASPPVQCPPALRNGFVTFGSLNKIVKVSRPCAALWAKVLDAVPNSRLLLQVPKGAVAGMRERLAAAGIPAGRLVIADKARGRAGYLRRFNEIDVCLDPFPFNGITTTCDSLWMGVPVVSLAGDTTVSRAGRSILHGTGLTHLALDDPSAYIRAAAALSGDMQGLCDLRRGMRCRLRASPLMDQPRFACQLEAAYRAMPAGPGR
jgi:predicted O-linked N-acetylglucosamine transferase (SPINDLY family)